MSKTEDSYQLAYTDSLLVVAESKKSQKGGS